MHLLGRHRLGFDDPATTGGLGDFEDDPPGFARVRRPVDVPTEPLDGTFQLFQVAIEVGQRVLLDALGVVAEFVAVGQGGVAAAVAGQQRTGQPHQGGLQRRIGQRLVNGARKIVMLVLCECMAHTGMIHRAGAPATAR